MKKFFLLFILININQIIFSLGDEYSPIYVTLNEPTEYLDVNNNPVKCIGKNQPEGIVTRFGGISRQCSGYYDSTMISGINGTKLINKQNNKETKLSCIDFSFSFSCSCSLINKTRLEPGNYYFKSEEELSGTPRLEAIKPHVSTTQFFVSNILPESENNFEKIIDFQGQQIYNLEFEYNEEVLGAPSFSYGEEKFSCSLNYKEPKKVKCPLRKENFIPSAKGNKYNLTLYTYCGDEDIKGVIIAKDSGDGSKKEENKKLSEDQVILITFLSALGILIIFAIIITVIVCYVLKKRGKANLNNVMATSFQNDQGRPIINENQENDVL